MNLECIKFELAKTDVPLDPIEQFTHLLRKEHEAGRLSFAVCMAHDSWRSAFQKLRWPQIIAADDSTEERLNEIVALAICGDVLLIGIRAAMNDLTVAIAALGYMEKGRAPVFSASPHTPWSAHFIPGRVNRSKEFKEALEVATKMGSCSYLYTGHDIHPLYLLGTAALPANMRQMEDTPQGPGRI